MRFALLATLLSGCRAACMLPSATEPTTAECQTLCDAGSCGCSAPWSVMRQETVSTGAVRWYCSSPAAHAYALVTPQGAAYRTMEIVGSDPTSVDIVSYSTGTTPLGCTSPATHVLAGCSWDNLDRPWDDPGSSVVNELTNTQCKTFAPSGAPSITTSCLHTSVVAASSTVQGPQVSGDDSRSTAACPANNVVIGCAGRGPLTGTTFPIDGTYVSTSDPPDISPTSCKAQATGTVDAIAFARCAQWATGAHRVVFQTYSVRAQYNGANVDAVAKTNYAECDPGDIILDCEAQCPWIHVVSEVMTPSVDPSVPARCTVTWLNDGNPAQADALCLKPVRSCKDHLTLGSTTSGVYTIVPPGGTTTLQVWCDMTTDGGGWTLLEKSLDGSSALVDTTEALNVGGLASPDVVQDAKVNDATLKAFLSDPNTAAELLWVPQEHRASPTLYFKLRYSYQSTIDAWSSGYRWDSTGIFDFYDWAAGEYKCCNGHVDNYDWSMFCDNGNHVHPLGPGCTTSPMSAGQGQTPFGGTSAAYYRFHHNTGKQANGDYLFYFR